MDIVNLFASVQMQTIVILIAIDVVLGLIASLSRKDFTLYKLANFMKGPVLAYVLGFAVIEIIGEAIPYLSFVVLVVFILVVLALLGSISRNLKALGLALPKPLS